MTNLVLVAAAAFYDETAKAVLMCQRAAHKSHPGEWEFPGGKIEDGETPEQALLRELREEMGVTVEAEDVTPAGFASYTYPHRHVILLLYVVRHWTGTPQLLDHQAMQWVPVSKLPDFAVLPADRPLIDRLMCYL